MGLTLSGVGVLIGARRSTSLPCQDGTVRVPDAADSVIVNRDAVRR